MQSFSQFLSNLKQTQLPITAQLDSIRQQLRDNSNLVLQAEPGAGKTTIVPLAVLDLVKTNQKILILEPRRLAARNAAERMASLISESTGETVGYRIRNERKVSAKTRIEVITEGILTRMLQSDPELPEVGLIIFDEFHERSLDADLGLALSLEVQESLRDDLKIMIMSATLDIQSISSLLNNAPIVQSKGRSFPVTTHYKTPRANKDWNSVLLTSVSEILKQQDVDPQRRDILVFLPGIAEINRAKNLLEDSKLLEDDVEVVTLYGDLPFEQQRKVLLPIANKRKIILSTNLAETSVTIQGIGYVIDSGLMRQSAFDPNVGFDRLSTRKISAASATQRTGRAGRLGPGECYRLWSESESLRSETQAEILRADLSSLVLELAQWGVSHSSELNLLDQPNEGSYKQAQVLLRSLKALDQNNKITSHGRKLLTLGVHPRIGHMLLESINLNATDFACLLAATIEERDVLQGEERFNPDFMARVNKVIEGSNNNRTISQIRKQAKNLNNKTRKLELNSKYSSNSNHQKTGKLSERDLHQSKPLTAVLLAMVFPDRLAQKRGNGYRLANGSGAIVGDDFFLLDDYLVVVRLGGHGATPKIFQAIPIDISEIENYFGSLIEEKEEVYWNEKTQSVKGEVNRKLNELVLDSKPLTNIDPSLIQQGIINAIKKKGINSLPWSKELRQWQARVSALRNIERFKSDFPDVSDGFLLENLSDWLAPYLNGINKLSQVTTDIIKQALWGSLDWAKQQELEQLMPLKLKVASGSNITVDYSQGDKPVLAVKLQEMFGEKETPRIAGGRLNVVVHLLSPARRPLQITEDLASFWANSYEDVKKEMKGRYPKHPWPDDPLSAEATRFTKKRQAASK